MQANINQNQLPMDIGNSFTDIIVLVDNEYNINSIVGKFVIPSLTPTMDLKNAQEDDIRVSPVINQINSTNSSVNISNTNYLMLSIPKYLFSIKEIKATNTYSKNSDGAVTSVETKCTPVYQSFKKGQQFLVTYVGNNKNRPYIIGVI